MQSFKKTFSKRDKLLTCTSTLVMHPLNINVKTLGFLGSAFCCIKIVL